MSSSPIQLAVMLYHKNIRNLYKASWIEKCIASVCGQSFSQFDIFELCYGEEQERSLRDEYAATLFKGPGSWMVEYAPCADHSVAMNHCLDTLCDSTRRSSTGHSYAAVANVNLDDFYHAMRFELQFAAIMHHDADLVSSSFLQIYDTKTKERDAPTNDRVLFTVRPQVRDREDLKAQMQKVNLIAHPVVMYSTRMWRRYEDICYRREIPVEDWALWKRVLTHDDLRVVIIDVHLLYYRLHGNQITKASSSSSSSVAHTAKSSTSSSSSSSSAAAAPSAAMVATVSAR